MFSPLVQSSVAASSQAAGSSVGTTSPINLPSVGESSLAPATLPTGAVPGFAQAELTQTPTSQDDHLRLYSPMTTTSTSEQGEMFTPHVGLAGLHPTQPPPPIPQFSFLNSSSGAPGGLLFQQQQPLAVSGTAISVASDQSVATASMMPLYPVSTAVSRPPESQPLVFSQASPAVMGPGLWTPINTGSATRGGETPAVTTSSHHGSMISQLLDSIFSDQAFSPHHSQHATSVTASSTPAVAPPVSQQMVTAANSAIPLPIPLAPVR